MRRPRRLAPAAQRALDAALIPWTVAWSWMEIAGVSIALEWFGLPTRGGR